MSVYRSPSHNADVLDNFPARPSLTATPASQRGAAIRLLKPGVIGPYSGLARLDTLLAQLRDSLTASGGSWATVPPALLDELIEMCDGDGMNGMADSKWRTPPHIMSETCEHIRTLMTTEFITPWP